MCENIDYMGNQTTMFPCPEPSIFTDGALTDGGEMTGMGVLFVNVSECA